MTLENLSNLLKKLAEIAEKNFEEEYSKPTSLEKTAYLEYWQKRAQILNTIVEVLNYYNH